MHTKPATDDPWAFVRKVPIHVIRLLVGAVARCRCPLAKRSGDRYLPTASVWDASPSAQCLAQWLVGFGEPSLGLFCRIRFSECSDEKRGVVRPRVYLVGRRIQMSKTRSTNRTSPRQSTLKTRHRNGYAEFFDENTRRWESTHRRTLAKRIGEDNLDGMQVHHIDGNKLNNTPHNLVALTPRMHGRVESVPTACFKCGRTSHWAKDCVAATDYKGTPLIRRRR